MPLSGDILMHPGYKNNKKKIKFYWNPSADQAFLYLGQNLYSLDYTNDGELQTKLLIEQFDLVSHGIENIFNDKISQKVYYR